MKEHFHYSLLLASVLFLVSLTSLSAASHYVTHLDVSDGLSDPKITTLVVDNDGRLWVGTKCGLNLFDGKRFLVIDGAALKGNYIQDIYVDSNGTVWAATEEGLSYYDAWNESFVMVTKEIIKKISEINGRTFFVTDHSIICCDAGVPLPVAEFGSEVNIKEILQINGISYIVCGSCLIRFDGSTAEFLPYHGFEGIVISAAWYDDLIWLGVYHKGLVAVDLDGNVKNEIHCDKSSVNIRVVLSMMVDESGSGLWLGTDGNGVCVMDSTGIRHLDQLAGYEDTRVLPNTILSLYRDVFNNIWVGSSVDGVYCLKSSNARYFYESPEALTYRTLTSICGDGTDVWLGTDGGGLQRYNVRTSEFERFNSTTGAKISSVCVYDKDHLLVSIYCEGVFLLNKKTGVLSRYDILDPVIMDRNIGSGNLVKVEPVGDGRFFVFAREPYIHNPQNRTNVELNLNSCRPLLYTCFVKNGYWYVIGERSLNRIDVQSGTVFPVYDFENGVFPYQATYYQDRIWIATNRGLFILDELSGIIEKYEPNMLRYVSFILQDCHNQLWIASNGMLFCCDGTSCKVFDESSGQKSNEILCGTSICNSVLLGGTSGFLHIDATGKMLNDIETRMVPEKVLVNGKQIQGQNRTYRFSGRPEEIRINYRLIGADPFHKHIFRYTISRNNKILETGSPELRIDNPKAGRYEILGEYLNHDGIWTGSEAPVHVLISLPVYAQVWFWVLVSVFVFVSFLIVRKVVRSASKTIMIRPDIPVIDSCVYMSDEKMMLKFDELLEENIGNENLDVNFLVQGMAMSRTALYEKIKSITGLGVGEYILKVRIDKARHYLKETGMTIAEISDALGFSSQRYFSTAFKRSEQYSPREYREKFKGTDEIVGSQRT